jgi:hypothetical protein
MKDEPRQKNGLSWFILHPSSFILPKEEAPMAPKKSRSGKKYFTAAEANATLPLVRAIVRDITALWQELQGRQDRLARLQQPNQKQPSDAYQEELQAIEAELERDEDRLREYVQELAGLGVELKDPGIGLIDFPGRIDGREVYLCWRYGEPEVAYWHELEAGYAGRQKLQADAQKA